MHPLFGEVPRLKEINGGTDPPSPPGLLCEHCVSFVSEPSYKVHRHIVIYSISICVKSVTKQFHLNQRFCFPYEPHRLLITSNLPIVTLGCDALSAAVGKRPDASHIMLVRVAQHQWLLGGSGSWSWGKTWYDFSCHQGKGNFLFCSLDIDIGVCNTENLGWCWSFIPSSCGNDGRLCFWIHHPAFCYALDLRIAGDAPGIS